MKKLVVLLLGLFTFSFANATDAYATEDLTQKERLILINEVGLSEDILDIISVEELRELIEDDAKIVSSNEEIVEFFETSKYVLGEPTTLGTIKPSKLKLTFSVAKLSNTSDGNKRYKLTGTFKWLSNPINAYKDALSIGYESGKGITLPTSKGKINGHTYEYSTYERGQKNLRERGTTPTDYSPGNGVGSVFNIRQGGISNQGYISQIVYMEKPTGTSNLKFEYGHSKLAFTPNFSVSKGVFGISIGKSMDSAYYADTLKW